MDVREEVGTVLVELSVVDQRDEAVNEVLRHNLSVTEVAARYGARQTVHRWIARYLKGGVGALADRSHRPVTCPHQMSPVVQARVLALRHHNPEWGPVRIAHQLGREGVEPVPGRTSIYRALLRGGLVSGKRRRRRRADYRRWERSRPMDLWQIDVVSVPLSDGRRISVLTGVDDHSRFCVLAKAIERATARPVCGALAEALRTWPRPSGPTACPSRSSPITAGCSRPGSAPTTARPLFDRLCRDNGIDHLLTRPYSPTTTGKIERFHGTLRTECFSKVELGSIEQVQATLDDYVARYNAERPHQALGMATPTERFHVAPPAEHSAEEIPAASLIPASEAASPDPGRPGEVIRKADSAGNFGLARARYSAGRWLAGQLVVVRCAGDVVEIYHAAGEGPPSQARQGEGGNHVQGQAEATGKQTRGGLGPCLRSTGTVAHQPERSGVAHHPVLDMMDER